jgi:phosphoribosylformylglycinamidine cyclo-ligase
LVKKLWENIPRVLPKNLTADIDYSTWKLPEIFKFLQNEGNVKDVEMHRTFNCGIGMVLICEKKNIKSIIKKLESFDEEVLEIGVIKKI